MKDVFDKNYPTKRLNGLNGQCETTAPYVDGGAYKTPKEVGAVYPHLVETYGQEAVDEVFIPKFEEMLQVTSSLSYLKKNKGSITLSFPSTTAFFLNVSLINVRDRHMHF